MIKKTKIAEAEVANGTGGNDQISAGNGIDSVNGLAGADTIHGGNADDVLAGGPGNDTIYGQNGKDSIKGGLGDDIIHGGRGDDVLEGAQGYDRLYGGAGNDELDNWAWGFSYGEAGDDFFRWNPGKDWLINGQLDGAMVIDGGSGEDHVKIVNKSYWNVLDDGQTPPRDLDHPGWEKSDTILEFSTYIKDDGTTGLKTEVIMGAAPENARGAALEDTTYISAEMVDVERLEIVSHEGSSVHVTGSEEAIQMAQATLDITLNGGAWAF